MALGGCSGGSKPAETSAAAEKSEAAADATTAAAEGGSSDAMHLSFYYPVNVGGDAAKLIKKIDVQLRTSEHRSMYSYVRLSIDRCTATYV